MTEGRYINVRIRPQGGVGTGSLNNGTATFLHRTFSAGPFDQPGNIRPAPNTWYDIQATHETTGVNEAFTWICRDANNTSDFRQT